MKVFDLCRQSTSDGDEEVNRNNSERTNRPFVGLCPAICVDYTWPINRAARFDDTGEFIGEVEARIREAFRAWQQDS